MKFALILVIFAIFAVVAPTSMRVGGACSKQGCSGELCGDEPMISPCIFKAEYACYQSATCARQTTGRCGWTHTDDLVRCLAGFGKVLPGN